jgi:hypothetical protein
MSQSRSQEIFYMTQSPVKVQDIGKLSTKTKCEKNEGKEDDAPETAKRGDGGLEDTVLDISPTVVAWSINTPETQACSNR